MNEQLLLATVLPSVCLLITLGFAFTPYLTRRGEQFGVTIPEDEYHNPVLVRLRASYRNRSLLLGLLLSVLSLVLVLLRVNHDLYAAPLFILLVSYLVLSVRFHSRMLRIKEQQAWAVKVSSTVAVDLTPVGKDGPSRLWLLVFPLLLLLTALCALHFYPAAPEVLPFHWHAGSKSGDSIPKSYAILWFFLITQLFVSVLMAFVFHIIRSARRQLDPDDLEGSALRGRAFRRAWSYAVIGLGTALNLISFLQLLSILSALAPFTANLLSGLLAAGILGGVILLSVRVGQGGSRVKFPSSVPGQTVSLRDDDRCWKLGSLYYNPDDPAIFVEKRFGIGWTCNFARPMSWVFFGGLLAFIGLMVWFSLWMAGGF